MSHSEEMPYIKAVMTDLSQVDELSSLEDSASLYRWLRRIYSTQPAPNTYELQTLHKDYGSSHKSSDTSPLNTILWISDDTLVDKKRYIESRPSIFDCAWNGLEETRGLWDKFPQALILLSHSQYEQTNDLHADFLHIKELMHMLPLETQGNLRKHSYTIVCPFMIRKTKDSTWNHDLTTYGEYGSFRPHTEMASLSTPNTIDHFEVNDEVNFPRFNSVVQTMLDLFSDRLDHNTKSFKHTVDFFWSARGLLDTSVNTSAIKNSGSILTHYDYLLVQFKRKLNHNVKPIVNIGSVSISKQDSYSGSTAHYLQHVFEKDRQLHHQCDNIERAVYGLPPNKHREGDTRLHYFMPKNMNKIDWGKAEPTPQPITSKHIFDKTPAKEQRMFGLSKNVIDPVAFQIRNHIGTVTGGVLDAFQALSESAEVAPQAHH